jgi:hypothetical protein
MSILKYVKRKNPRQEDEEINMDKTGQVGKKYKKKFARMHLSFNFSR